MAADVGLVSDAAQRDARELAAQRARDGLAQRRLADAWRSDQRDDRARPAAAQHLEPALLAQLAHGEELDDAVLHVRETGVIFVEDLPGLRQVVVVLRAHVPRDVEHPVQVRADPAILRVLLARALQAVELAVDLGQHVLRHACLGDALAVGRHDVGLALVELPLDRLHLLAQEELALRLLHALGDVVADLLLERRVGEDGLRPLDQRLEAHLQVRLLEDLELLLGRQVRRVAGEVRQVAGGAGRAQELHDLGHAARLDQVLEQGAVFARQLQRALGWRLRVEDRVGLDPQRPADVGLTAAQPGAVLAADHEGLGPGRQLRRLAEPGDGAHGAELAVDARHEEDQAVALAGGLDGRLLAVPFDREGDAHVGEDDDVVHGEDGQ